MLKLKYAKLFTYLLLTIFIFTPQTTFAAKQIIRGDDGAFYVIDTEDPNDTDFADSVNGEEIINQENDNVPIPQKNIQQNNEESLTQQDIEDAEDYQKYENAAKKNKITGFLGATLGTLVVAGALIWIIIAGID